MREWYPKNGRVILHVDANSYFASVEMAKNPSLKGKPLAIAGNPMERRGILVTCNYEAREYGLYTTMPLWEAKKKCPDLVVMKPNHALYRETSQKLFNYMASICPIVEPVSIDECYIDITDCYQLGSPMDIAKMLQNGVLEQFDLPVSIGIAPNKFLAKTASDMRKPRGITVLRKRDIPSVLWPLPVIEMHGVGEKTAEKLKNKEILTIEDIAKADDIVLRKTLGIMGIHLKERANGLDNRIVNPDSVFEVKSVGNSTTLPQNITEEKAIADEIGRMAMSVTERMKKRNVVTQSIQITIRYSDFKTITRSRKLERMIEGGQELLSVALNLFRQHWNGDAVRLVGVTAMDVVDKQHAYKQLDLFSYEEDAKKEPLYDVTNSINESFGEHTIRTASSLLYDGKRRPETKRAEK
ncbi:DNA polymerase IV [Priestia megaterium]|nr:DNA polymerase IV [Priestia megaterium]